MATRNDLITISIIAGLTLITSFLAGLLFYMKDKNLKVALVIALFTFGLGGIILLIFLITTGILSFEEYSQLLSHLARHETDRTLNMNCSSSRDCNPGISDEDITNSYVLAPYMCEFKKCKVRPGANKCSIDSDCSIISPHCTRGICSNYTNDTTPGHIGNGFIIEATGTECTFAGSMVLIENQQNQDIDIKTICYFPSYDSGNASKNTYYTCSTGATQIENTNKNIFCITGVCNASNKTCINVGIGQPCEIINDNIYFDQCGETINCSIFQIKNNKEFGTCQKPGVVARQAGASCQNDTQCISGLCVKNVCSQIAVNLLGECNNRSDLCKFSSFDNSNSFGKVTLRCSEQNFCELVSQELDVSGLNYINVGVFNMDDKNFIQFYVNSIQGMDSNLDFLKESAFKIASFSPRPLPDDYNILSNNLYLTADFNTFLVVLSSGKYNNLLLLSNDSSIDITNLGDINNYAIDIYISTVVYSSSVGDVFQGYRTDDESPFLIQSTFSINLFRVFFKSGSDYSSIISMTYLKNNDNNNNTLGLCFNIDFDTPAFYYSSELNFFEKIIFTRSNFYKNSNNFSLSRSPTAWSYSIDYNLTNTDNKYKKLYPFAQSGTPGIYYDSTKKFYLYFSFPHISNNDFPPPDRNKYISSILFVNNPLNERFDVFAIYETIENDPFYIFADVPEDNSLTRIIFKEYFVISSLPEGIVVLTRPNILINGGPDFGLGNYILLLLSFNESGNVTYTRIPYTGFESNEVNLNNTNQNFLPIIYDLKYDISSTISLYQTSSTTKKNVKFMFYGYYGKNPSYDFYIGRVLYTKSANGNLSAEFEITPFIKSVNSPTYSIAQNIYLPLLPVKITLSNSSNSSTVLKQVYIPNLGSTNFQQQVYIQLSNTLQNYSGSPYVSTVSNN
jgi:hypothetical protein